MVSTLFVLVNGRYYVKVTFRVYVVFVFEFVRGKNERERVGRHIAYKS